jgi:hypothetical protein
MDEAITLGALIGQLKGLDAQRPVYFDVWGLALHPTGLGSYRGSYDELAMGFENEGSPPTVADVLSWCESANGATYSGWKGGEFTMTMGTPVWVANTGYSHGVALVGAEAHRDWAVVLKTAVTSHADY